MHGVMMLQVRGIAMYNVADAWPRQPYMTRVLRCATRASGRIGNMRTGDVLKLRARKIRKRRRTDDLLSVGSKRVL